jgi:dihydroorotate dehydrogenase electron transfer subunit
VNPWQAPSPALADLKPGRVQRHAGGVLEVEFPPGLPAAAPGQFVMVDGGDSALPHPFTPFRALPGGGFSLLLRPQGRPVAALLARRRAGKAVRVFGPLGRPFPPPPPGARAFALAEGGRLAPLHLLARLLGEAGGVTLLVGGDDDAHFAALAAFRLPGVRVERRRGGGWPAVEAVLARAGAGDVVYAAAPEPALARLDRALTDRGGGGPRAFLALEVAMACGVGACYGCPVPLRRPSDPRRPYARACADGPVFAAGEVALG